VDAIHPELCAAYSHVLIRAQAATLQDFGTASLAALEAERARLDAKHPGALGVQQRAWVIGARDTIQQLIEAARPAEETG
jgi:hypothetical protein